MENDFYAKHKDEKNIQTHTHRHEPRTFRSIEYSAFDRMCSYRQLSYNSIVNFRYTSHYPNPPNILTITTTTTATMAEYICGVVEALICIHKIFYSFVWFLVFFSCFRLLKWRICKVIEVGSRHF
jgi:hypothetical protein